MQTTADILKHFNSHQQVASLMGCDRSTVTKWAASGSIPAQPALELAQKLPPEVAKQVDVDAFLRLAAAEAAALSAERGRRKSQKHAA